MPGQSHPTAPVLTRRGRLVLTFAVTVLAVCAALTVQTLSAGSTPPDAPVTGGMMSRTTPAPGPSNAVEEPAAGGDTPAAEVPGSAAPLLLGEVAPTATADQPAPEAAVVVVNGREQPPLVEVPAAATGRLATVGGTTAPVTGDRVWTYRVEVEEGLPFDGTGFADAVHATLSDPRGWATDGHVFQRLDTDAVDFRLILASPALTDQLCAPLQTMGRVSCRNGDLVVLNALRWATGVDGYAGDVASYREYQVNHEVGHRLGRSHVGCPGAGVPAPVMMQQTYGLDGCAQNSWPLPGE